LPETPTPQKPTLQYIWEVDCETPLDAKRLKFHAFFYGREEDMPVFLKIVEGVTPVK